MTRGKALSDDLRGAILNMSRFLDIPEICHYTNCKKRTVERILEDYHKKGTVMREHLRLEMRGAKRSMSAGDLRFLTGVVRHSPDVYLDELRELLEETRGSEVSEATIWRSLKRCGFTMKKVCTMKAFTHILADICT
ncbi:hypothetical protein GGX14DRAFT_377632 [Mycena pura]|uniref:Transposase Tc1-like domain-containing protein n=1 Tax=Mycena pura TaxID=153505 RepID=A0AAD6V174_9AGAR|nr:hypothetical protein GGX14DRAFT_377632 [Mycena pura]